ncbi:Choline transporter protein [Rutstroemia sp. NJR-2017a BVV2]|nr:Choline transporter protein [Rutstroemia sp. NJR-2017a BVV2]PQE18545.1 Choline transporter protein [Rutstroemia sp. NJR-2017a BVV2]
MPLINVSKDASRFLAQSQSRFSNFVQQDNESTPTRNTQDRHQRSQPLRSSRYTQRLGNPYQSSHLPNFAFTSRYSQAPPDAPLFHSALDEFREEDDEEERERETADFFALQRSRRVFAPATLEESSETDRDGSDIMENDGDEDGRAVEDRGRPGRGIKSSWNGGVRSTRERGRAPATVGEEAEEDGGRPSSHGSDSKGKGRMVEVGLESTIAESDAPSELVYEMQGDDSPPAFQTFRSAPRSGPIRLKNDLKKAVERDIESGLPAGPRYPPPPSEADTVPATVGPSPLPDGPKHDVFWGSLFMISFGALFATFFLIYLHTSTPGKALGDTIYTTLNSSFHLFAVDTVVTIIVSFIWLALLRSFVRPLVFLIVLAVPVILLSFSLYPLVSSIKGTSERTSVQDRVMRWLSFIPSCLALLWVYTIYKGRKSLTKAISILEFASRILAASPGLAGLGFSTLAAVVIWTWVWLGMFTRVFLGGHLSKSGFFIIDQTTWWLGVFFVVMYIWTVSVIGGVQRTTTAATVSQWYFHRNVQPALSSREVVGAAFTHSTTTIFGTICLSTLLALLIRLPLLIFPRRLVAAVSIVAYSIVPAPVSALLNPLTLTYAAIHSQPLQISARGLSQMTFLTPQAPTTTLTPRSFSSRTHASQPLLPYRLAKLLLHATRIIMALSLGFGGWVATARQLSITMPQGAGIKGSAYAYVVGLVASFIGWGVLGAMERVLSGIVDATVVCWGSEKGMVGGGAYCLEARYLFGDEREGS